jgi:hypothetical protein
MATLKGQNFRIFQGDKVVGMATNCTCTLTGNTEDASHKDLVSMAQAPSIVSKSWSVSVESLDVTDIAAVLTAIKNQTPFTLKWDETAITDNQTALAASYARTGTAYLNDVTFTWDDRTNSTKSLQFTGSGPLEKIVGEPTTDVITPSTTYTKGQFVRLFLGSDNTATPSKVIAAAKQLSLHVSMTLEDATTKDTDGDWQAQEPTGLSYDISTTALIRSGDTITSSVAAQSLPDIEEIYEASLPVKWLIAPVSGANQRTKGTTIVSGSVVLTQLTLNGPNRQNADYSASLSGFGPYEVGA